MSDGDADFPTFDELMAEPAWSTKLDEILNDATDRQSAWEIRFADQLFQHRRSVIDWHPTPTQEGKIEEIWQKLFGV